MCRFCVACTHNPRRALGAWNYGACPARPSPARHGTPEPASRSLITEYLNGVISKKKRGTRSRENGDKEEYGGKEREPTAYREGISLPLSHSPAGITALCGPVQVYQLTGGVATLIRIQSEPIGVRETVEQNMCQQKAGEVLCSSETDILVVFRFQSTSLNDIKTPQSAYRLGLFIRSACSSH